MGLVARLTHSQALISFMHPFPTQTTTAAFRDERRLFVRPLGQFVGRMFGKIKTIYLLLLFIHIPYEIAYNINLFSIDSIIPCHLESRS